MASPFSIRIVRLPPGTAPIGLRRALVGQVIPLHPEGNGEPVPGRRPGVSRPGLSWRRRDLAQKRRERGARAPRAARLVYEVDHFDLFEVLRLTAPEVVAWWRTAPMHLLGGVIELPASCCERILAVRPPLREVASRPESGYRVVLRKNSRRAPSAPFAHRFCGAHDLVGAHCPNCDKPLLLLLSLDTADPRLELTDFGVATLPLLCCWTCSWNTAVVQYRVHRERIELLRCPRGGVTKDFPYADYPLAFAGAPFDLVPVASRARTADETRAPITQIGGVPRTLDGPPPWECCHVCGRAMVFLATVGDTMPDGSSLTGNAWVQMVFLLCPEDRVVAVTHEVD